MAWHDVAWRRVRRCVLTSQPRATALNTVAFSRHRSFEGGLETGRVTGIDSDTQQTRNVPPVQLQQLHCCRFGPRQERRHDGNDSDTSETLHRLFLSLSCLQYPASGKVTFISEGKGKREGGWRAVSPSSKCQSHENKPKSAMSLQHSGTSFHNSTHSPGRRHKHIFPKDEVWYKHSTIQYAMQTKV